MNLYATVPPWARVTGLIALVVVTVLLVSAHWAAPVQSGFPITDRMAELQDKEVTLNLALEFGFDPMIVQVVRNLSGQSLRLHRNATTWRFVKTEQDLSYLMLSIIQIESHGQYAAYNPGGPAYGLTQLIMSTARDYDKNVTDKELLTIPKNLDIAMQHFIDVLDEFNGNPYAAAFAWNQGVTGVRRAIALGTTVEGAYARSVFTQAAMRNAQP